MEQLLSKYSISDMLIFLVMLSAAVKGVVTGFDWFKEKARIWIHKDEQFETLEQRSDRRDDAIEKKISEIVRKQEKEVKALKEKNDFLQANIERISKNVDLLIESDKDDIKAWITRQHYYFCYDLGEIDTYSLDCIERRYKHYRDENGNSFIAGLMEEIRSLPKIDAAKALEERRAAKEQLRKKQQENN